MDDENQAFHDGELVQLALASPGCSMREVDIPGFLRDLNRLLVEYRLGIVNIYLSGETQIGSRDRREFIRMWDAMNCGPGY